MKQRFCKDGRKHQLDDQLNYLLFVLRYVRQSPYCSLNCKYNRLSIVIHVLSYDLVETVLSRNKVLASSCVTL